MSKALGIVLSVSGGTLGEINGISAPTEIDLLLHPRVPPLVRSLPHVEMLSLFRAEESQEESDTRTNVGLGVVPDESDIAELLAPTVNVLPRETLAEVAEATRNASRPQVQAQKYAAMQVDVAPPAAPSAVVAKVAEPSIPSALAVPAMPPAAASTLENFHVPPSSLPPPPDPLPSSTAASGPRSTTIPAPPTTPTAPPPMPTEEEADDDDDEPMPTIDMGSDSDSE